MKTVKIIFEGKTKKLAQALYFGIIKKLKEDPVSNAVTQTFHEGKSVIIELKGEDKIINKVFSGNFSLKNRLSLRALGFKIKIE